MMDLSAEQNAQIDAIRAQNARDEAWLKRNENPGRIMRAVNKLGDIPPELLFIPSGLAFYGISRLLGW